MPFRDNHTIDVFTTSYSNGDVEARERSFVKKHTMLL
jgi:hypothetical protein